MRKLFAMFLAAVMMLSLVACSGGKDTSASETSTPAASTESEAPVEKVAMSLCAVHAADSPIDLVCKKMEELLNDTGLFEITYYGQGQYGNQGDMMESLLAGDNVLVIAGPSDVADATGITDVGTLLAPFLLDTPQETEAITSSDWWADICEQSHAANVHIIGGNLLIEGARYFWTHTPVVEPSDMAPLKFRTPATTNYLNTFQAFGTTPVSIAVGDLYTALQNGTVDAFEFPLADGYAWQLNEVSEYISNQSYVTGVVTLTTSAGMWDSLSAEHQAALNECVAEAAEYGIGVYEEKTNGAVNMLKDAGMEFYDVNIDAYRACVDKYYELSPFSDGLQDVLDEIMTDYRANH